MYHSAAALRVLPRRPHLRSFHSPFVVLNAANHLSTHPASSAAPVYEKQDDTSSEPHLSSSGTRTYVVSEPDPSDTPYQVPSGAYPASASYQTTIPVNEGLHNSTSSPLLDPHSTRARPHKEAGVGQSGAAKSTAASGEAGRRAGRVGLIDTASSKPSN